MSTPEEPPQLTRRQLRELRNTAATPIVTDAPASSEPPAPTPLPRAAEPVVLPEPPTAEPVASGSPSLTRREVRQRERLRTASVPVITAEVLAAAAAEAEADEAAHREDAVVEAEIVDAVPDAVAGDAEPATEDWSDPEASADDAPEDDAIELEQVVEDAPATATDDAAEPTAEDASAEDGDPSRPGDERADAEPAEEPAATETPAEEPERRVIAEDLGSDILRGHPADVEIPASFDQLLTRGSTATGALSMPNALILSQTPDGGGFTSPVTATGEVLITGTFALPDHYGSTGTVPGRADGKDVDAVLIDGELPAASSPTPIAASAAISTIKSADEIIKPPAPEKGSRLMVVLAITAGVLAVALAGVLILAITTGVF
jgi:hypothetical protein